MYKHFSVFSIYLGPVSVLSVGIRAIRVLEPLLILSSLTVNPRYFSALILRAITQKIAPTRTCKDLGTQRLFVVTQFTVTPNVSAVQNK